MKNKRVLLTVVALALVLATAVGMVACSKPVQIRETEVVIHFDASIMPDFEGKHLVDYLNVLQEKDYFTYSASYGYINEINGKKADYEKDRTAWMIYTDDEENSDKTYAYTMDGKEYGSASFGINDLPLKKGKTYIFVISQF